MSATTSALRASLRRLSSCRRHSSSRANSPSSKALASPATSLPPKKLRALVSLYHQSDTFITPETLSEAIDDAFIVQKNQDMYVGFNPELSYRDLQARLDEQEQEPKIGSSTGLLSDYTWDRSWSSLETLRERQAVDALCGVEGRGKPGAEVLLEEAERIQEIITADKEDKGQA